jgi:hypothetical protein
LHITAVIISCHLGPVIPTSAISGIQKWLNRQFNVTIRKCSSRAFQWMVMSVGFGAISMSHPWWQKSPSDLNQLTHSVQNFVEKPFLCNSKNYKITQHMYIHVLYKQLHFF